MQDARRCHITLVPLLPEPVFDVAARKLGPHIVPDAPEDNLILQREIFGTQFHLRAYTPIDMAIARVSAGSRPLPVYPFITTRVSPRPPRL